MDRIEMECSFVKTGVSERCAREDFEVIEASGG